MIRMMIIDDEPLVLHWLTKTIDWSELGIEVVATADNGLIAQKKISQYHPELILTDLNMPVMSGLELIEHIKETTPDTEVVILSGVEEFESAKKALNLGVFNYILKPSSNEEIIRIIENVTGGLKLQQSEAYKKIINSIVHGKGLLKENIPLLQSFFDLDINENYFTVSLLQTDASSKQSGDDCSLRIESLTGGLRTDIINTTLTEHDGSILVLGQYEFHSSSRSIRKQLNNRSEKIIQYLDNTYDCPHLIGNSRVYKGISSIHKAYEDAKRALDTRVYNPDTSVFNYTSGDETTLAHVDIATVIQSISASIKQGDIKQMKAFIDALYEQLSTNKAFSLADLQKMYIQIALTSKSLTQTSLHISSNDEQPDLNSINHFLCCNTLIDLNKQLITTLTAYAKTVKNNRIDQMTPMEKGLLYIESHITEPLTLNEVAGHIGLSPAYFSELFKKEHNMKYIDYVTGKKMVQAKQFLQTSSMKISDIAKSLGYSDARYFGQCFKKVTGKTPTEYRQ